MLNGQRWRGVYYFVIFMSLFGLYSTALPQDIAIEHIEHEDFLYWNDSGSFSFIINNEGSSANFKIDSKITGEKFDPVKGVLWQEVKTVKLHNGINKIDFKYNVDSKDGWGLRDFSVNISDSTSRSVRFVVIPGVVLEAVDASKSYFTASEPVDIKCVLSNESENDQSALLTIKAVNETGEKVLVNQANITVKAGHTFFYPYKLRRRYNTKYIDAYLMTSDGQEIMSERVMLQKKVSPMLDGLPKAALSTCDNYDEKVLEEMDSFAEDCPYIVEASKGGGMWGAEFYKLAKARGLMTGWGHFFDNNPGVGWLLHTTGPQGDISYQNHPKGIGQAHGGSKVLWLTQAYIRQFINKDAEWFNNHEALYECEPSGCFGTGFDYGDYAPIYGYRKEEVKVYRRILAGLDSGVRFLSDERNYRRINFQEVFELVYDRPLPEPKELGFKSWAEYEPERITLPQIHGEIKDDMELQKVRFHLLLLAYCQARTLDMWSQHMYNSSLECQLVFNWDFIINGQFSYLLYRLPYIQNYNRELFLSVYDQCINSNYVDGSYWRAICEKYDKRFRLLKEIGHGGSNDTYFTPSVGLVGAYSEVAAAKFNELQVDWHWRGTLGEEPNSPEKGLLLDSTLQNKPELSDKGLRVLAQRGVYKGFAQAWDDGAERIHDIPSLLLLTSDRIRYPSAFRGYNRWGDMHIGMGRPENGFVEWSKILRENGHLYDTYRTPVFDPSYLNRYRTIVFTAVRHSKGTLEQLQDWLMVPPDGAERTLIVNNVLPLQLDLRKDSKWTPEKAEGIHHIHHYGRLEWPLDASVDWRRRASDVWSKLGVKVDEPKKRIAILFKTPKNSPLAGYGFDVKFDKEISTYIIKAPKNAEIWLESGKGDHLVWSLPVGFGGYNRILYVALPFEVLPVDLVSSNEKEILERLANVITSEILNHRPIYSYTDKEAFVGIYRKTKAKGYKVAIMRKGESLIPHRNRHVGALPPEQMWKWVDELAPVREDILNIYGLKPNSCYKLIESESGQVVIRSKSDSSGRVVLEFSVGMAGLYDLEI